MRQRAKGLNGATDELGRDMEVAGLLDRLSPAVEDPNYWMRFKAHVLRAASPELARRRMMADVTMADVLTSWARALVPTAMLAAAAAGFLMLRTHTAPASVPARVEELLVAGIEGEAIPTTLSRTEAETQVAFAAERF